MNYLISALFFLTLFSSCVKNKNKSQCNYNPCDVSAPVSEIATVENYLSTNSIIATKHCSGLYYVIDAVGTGALPDICSVVSVKYKGQLSNGSVFDQATTAINFNLNQLIEAWKKGIILIRPGGKIRMWVPPSLAYGSQDVKDGSGNVVIPANSQLFFEVELISVL
jgi:FKBP-type peptidyl-prolyl cis-trans isomerase FkpA